MKESSSNCDKQLEKQLGYFPDAVDLTLTPKARLIDLRKIWDRAEHNALTDLIWFRGRWHCTFREGMNHISPCGQIRILVSQDGVSWNSSALLSIPDVDLRDPKLTMTPQGYLMLNAAAAYDPEAPKRHQSLVWYSSDGVQWNDPIEIGDPNYWLWRVIWFKDRAYGVAYSTRAPLGTRLYSSIDGVRFDILVDKMFEEDFPNEATIVFDERETAFCLLRRDGEKSATAQLGIASAPYIEWHWKDLGVRIGGPHMLRLPNGRIVAAIRRYGKTPWTSLNWLDPVAGSLTEFLALPSGGDTSYAGLCWRENLLWVSYYSSHEQRTSIYLAKIQFEQ